MDDLRKSQRNAYVARAQRPFGLLSTPSSHLATAIGGLHAALTGQATGFLERQKPRVNLRAHATATPAAYEATHSLTNPSAPADAKMGNVGCLAKAVTPSPALCLWPAQSWTEVRLLRSQTRIEQSAAADMRPCGCKGDRAREVRGEG